jgi:hypothetical protein
MPYNISVKFHPIPSTLNFSRFFVATAAILKITQFNTKVNNKLFEAYKFQSGRRCHGNYF